MVASRCPVSIRFRDGRRQCRAHHGHHGDHAYAHVSILREDDA